MSETRNRELIEQFIEQVWNDDQVELLDQLASSPPPATHARYPYQGVSGQRHLIDDYRRAFPDTTLTINYTIEQDEIVVVNVTAHLVSQDEGDRGNKGDKGDKDEKSDEVAAVSAVEQPSPSADESGTADSDSTEPPSTEPPVPPDLPKHDLAAHDLIAHADNSFFLIFQIVGEKIISVQCSPSPELMKFLQHAPSHGSHWQSALHTLKLPPRLETVLVFCIDSISISSSRFARMWRRKWPKPIFRISVVVLLFILAVSLGTYVANLFAAKVIVSWLERDFYYIKLPYQARELGSVDHEGSKLVFASSSGNIIEGDTNGTTDIFIATANLDKLTAQDKAKGTTTLTATIQLVSINTDKGFANGWSRDPAITPDGRYVTFTSVASNLVKNFDYGASPVNLYVRDLLCKKTYLVRDVFAKVDEGYLRRNSTFSNNKCSVDRSLLNTAVTLSNSPNVLPILYRSNATDGERQRLLQQQDRALGLAERHLEIVMFYYVRFFSSIIITALSAMGAAIILYFISRDGWNNHNDLLHIPFVGLVACSILFGAIPNFFEFDSNIDANKRAFVAAMTVENQIASYMSTGTVYGKVPDPKDSEKQIDGVVDISPSEFISRVDGQLTELFGLAIDMNAEEIPGTTEILEKIQGAGQPLPADPVSRSGAGASVTR